jgi:UDP-3-O-[3-hydroxymyristoyl] glucosamine N-acyltransferase
VITESNAGVIICKSDLRGLVRPKDGQVLIFVENPRLAFIRIFGKMLTMATQQKIQAERHDLESGTNAIDATRSRISSKSVISKSAKIGQNCVIGDFVVVGDNCVIGDGTVIYDRVSLVQNCIVGKNCVIQSGVSMGSDGFAFERNKEMKLEKFPHKGYLIIGDNVEICVNCSIARGSLSDTKIGDGTKLDALVHIAHNVVIGKNCALTAGTVIGGSTVLGDNCWTGLNSTLKHKIRLGNNVIVGSGASVIHDVPDADIVAGVPAKSIKDKIHISAEELFMMAGIERPEPEQ